MTIPHDTILILPQTDLTQRFELDKMISIPFFFLTNESIIYAKHEHSIFFIFASSNMNSRFFFLKTRFFLKHSNWNENTRERDISRSQEQEHIFLDLQTCKPQNHELTRLIFLDIQTKM